MPSATDIVVKNAAAQDKTFSLITPAAGDGGVAQWALKEGTTSQAFPVLTISATQRQNGRQLKLKLVLPSTYVDTATGLTGVSNRAEINMTVAIPASYLEAKKDDLVAYTANIINSAPVRVLIRDALSAT